MMAGAKVRRTAKTMVVAGVMSGTSGDGVDVALVRLSATRGKVAMPKLEVLGHRSFPYSKAMREAVLRAMGGDGMRVPEIARLHWRLGEVYADAVERTAAKFGVEIGLVGMHGQTIYHQAEAAKYLGGAVRATWQIGEAAIVAERLHVPVVSDFRPADLAAGGQGAPLVPMLDFCVFGSRTRNRILLNLGGIANLTVIPAAASLDALMAFDSGPANMVIDALMQAGFGKAFDQAGRVAKRGRVLPSVVGRLVAEPYFAAAPPKSCGREQFGAAFVDHLRSLCVADGGSDADMVATATELTVVSILDAYGRFCWPHMGKAAPLAPSTELFVAGGGVRNKFLMGKLQQRFEALGVGLRSVDEFGFTAQSKEAVAFALLGWLSWNDLPGNVPAATGARRRVVLGKVTCA